MRRALPSTMLLLVLALAGSIARAQVTEFATSNANVTSASTTGSISLNLASLSGSHNTLLVGVSIVGLTSTTPAVSSITWNGTALTPECSIQESASSSNWVSMAIYALQNPSASNSTVAITLSGSTVFQAGAVAFTNVQSVGTCVTTTTKGGDNVSSTSVTVTAPGTGGAVFDTLAVNSIVAIGSLTMTPTAGQTSLCRRHQLAPWGRTLPIGGVQRGRGRKLRGQRLNNVLFVPWPKLEQHGLWRDPARRDPEHQAQGSDHYRYSLETQPPQSKRKLMGIGATPQQGDNHRLAAFFFHEFKSESGSV